MTILVVILGWAHRCGSTGVAQSPQGGDSDVADGHGMGRKAKHVKARFPPEPGRLRHRWSFGLTPA